MPAERLKEPGLCEDPRVVLKHVALDLDITDAQRVVWGAAHRLADVVSPTSGGRLLRNAPSLVGRKALGPCDAAESLSARFRSRLFASFVVVHACIIRIRWQNASIL